MPSSIYLELHHEATPLHGPRFLILIALGFGEQAQWLFDMPWRRSTSSHFQITNTAPIKHLACKAIATNASLEIAKHTSVTMPKAATGKRGAKDTKKRAKKGM
jgi:hypothetical protein